MARKFYEVSGQLCLVDFAERIVGKKILISIWLLLQQKIDSKDSFRSICFKKISRQFYMAACCYSTKF